MGLTSCRVYVQGQNLLTFTKYSGLDPDVSATNVTDGYAQQRDLSLGVDNGRYPWTRTLLVGLNVKF